ncbi:MAG: hypothetical protein KAI24_23995, partial [Planctomycetes bacterium]|nr:hypothetical protein [Planctomycetota bacterium]
PGSLVQGLGVLTFCVGGNSDGGDDTDTDPSDGTLGKSDAIYLAQEFVKQNLKSPSTARFPGPSHWQVTKTDEGYTVKSFVDARNGFGATMRRQVVIDMEPVGDGDWRCTSCIFSK